MKKMKLTDDVLESSPFGVLAKAISNQMKVLTDTRTKVEGCFISSAENGKPIVDPFLAKLALPHILAIATDALPVVGSLEETLGSWIEGECRRAGSSFEASLTNWCKRHGYRLDGHFPSFVIDGFCPISVDVSKGIANVANHKIKSILFDASAPLIAEVVAQERRRNMDPAKFIEALCSAYHRMVALGSLQPGDPVPVKSIYEELVFSLQSAQFRASGKAAQFLEYTWDYFSRDLGKLIATPLRKTQKGLCLKVGPTSFAEEGLPVRDQEGVRYIGKITFLSEDAL
jgi:hypothetical protein